MVFFTDFFGIKESLLEEYGAFNISLINDLPLFIDPFLLYGSEKDEYQKAHDGVLKYLSFLKNKSLAGQISKAQIASWYKFPEVKQNWLGFSVSGNGGNGLGEKFGKAMSANMHIVFDDLNTEEITRTSHLEKVGLFEIGVGKDNISDFTCNLIKSFLLNYTEEFAKKYLVSPFLKEVMVDKVIFDYEIERWMPKKFSLPYYNEDYIILTPKDLLTKDENWINTNDLIGSFSEICNSIPNYQLRSEVQNFYKTKLPAPQVIGVGSDRREKKIGLAEIAKAINETVKLYPDLFKYFIKNKEDDVEGAIENAAEKVKEVEILFNTNVPSLINKLITETEFYKALNISSYKESMKRVLFLKDVIENKDGYKLFYYNGQPIKREADLQVIYRLTWFSSPLDINREVNNGRGPVDYSASFGSDNKTLVEFKLASNSKLKMNLQHQVSIYESANNTNSSIKVILYFDMGELKRVAEVLKELNLIHDNNIVLIDAGKKLSASNAK